MREITFRGKRIDNGDWVCGLFARCKIGNLILPCIQTEHESDSGDFVDHIEIDGETLGQYTGLKDKNGKEIYEGDIIEYRVEPQTKRYSVTFIDGQFCTNLSSLKAVRLICEVIGNIYENPELLEAAE